MNRFVLIGLALINGVLLLVRLPPSGDDASPKLRVGLVFDIGGRGDKSFNDLAYAAIERARTKLGVAAEYIEPGDGSDRESGLRLLAAKGVDLVIAAGFLFSDDMVEVAREYPRVHFACIDYAKFDAHGLVPPPPNMVALKFREEEGTYLIGAIAALSSRTRSIGFVGGMDMPLIRRFEAGYRQGALAVCPSCRLLSGYAGMTAEAFKNPSKGKELALAQYAQGADVIFHASGSTGLGVFEAAREMDRFAIGVDADQADEAPGHVLTSMIKRADVAVFELITKLAEGHWRGGVRTFGLAEKALDYVYDGRNRSLVPAQARAQAEQLRDEIIRGQRKVMVNR